MKQDTSDPDYDPDASDGSECEWTQRHGSSTDDSDGDSDEDTDETDFES